MADNGATTADGSALTDPAVLASLAPGAETAAAPTYDVHTIPAYSLSIDPDKGARVLFIEDDPAISEMYRVKLELNGYTVVLAGDGETGLETASEHPTAIVFLDIGLPDMDGLAVLEALRANDTTRNIPVVMLSNYGDAEQVERSLELGALDYLVKAETTPSMLAGHLRKWIKPSPPRSDNPDLWVVPQPELEPEPEPEPLMMSEA